MKLMDEYGQASVTGPNLIRSRDQAFCFTHFYKKELSTSPSPSPFKNSETELTTCGTPQPNIETCIHDFIFICRSFVWRGKLRKGTCLGNWKPGI